MSTYRTAACDDDTFVSAFEDEFGLDRKSRLLEVYEWLEEDAAARESDAAHTELDGGKSGYSARRDTGSDGREALR